MKVSKSALLTLAISSVLAIKSSDAQLLPSIAKIISNSTVKNVYAGLSFHYLDLEDRLLILNNFLKAVELEYALLPLKEKRIGLNFNKLKEESILLENSFGNILISNTDRKNQAERERVSFLQSKSNMQFLDRMQVLVAKFKDTHFSIQEKIERPLVYTGLRFYRIEGKIIVGAIAEKFMGMASKLSGTNFSRIAVGDEVILINGKPVEEKIKELKSFIGGSSDEFIDNLAVRGLTLRNYNYDENNSITISFKKAGTFKLPLFANREKNSTPRLDAITFFNKIGIPSDSATIGMAFDESSKQWNDSELTFSGYSPSKLHLNLKGLVEYKGDNGSPALRTGYYISKGKTYGVLQILTFYTKKVKLNDNEMGFIDGIKSFISELKANQLPLILDLRINGGGNGGYPAQVLSAIGEEGAIYPGPSMGFRMTSYMRQLQEPDLFQEIVGEDQTTDLTRDEMKNFFQETIDEKRDYTPMFSQGIVLSDIDKVGGFNNKIVALVTENCISACDMMSFLLKSSKRATIIGTHSNGTGAGFLSSSELNTKWEDQLRVLNTQIPNFLFGIPGNSYKTTVFDINSVETMCSENKPTFADVQYAPTMLDVAKNNLGWLQKAAQVIEGSNK